MDVHTRAIDSTMLTRRRKAAMIVQMMISDGGSLSLSELPEPLQEALAGELGDLVGHWRRPAGWVTA